jgi:hypothetical protein
MKVLVITSCTGEKKHKPENQLVRNDFEKRNTVEFTERENALKSYNTAAREIYTGQQHVRLIRGLDLIRQTCPDVNLDLKIVSAGYGLLNENDLIAPYEMTFNGMSSKGLSDWADFLQLPQNVLPVFKKYDLILFLLGKEYLKALKLPKTIKPKGHCVFLTSKGSLSLIPESPKIHTITLANPDAKRFGAGLVALKGRIFELLGEHIKENGPNQFSKLIESPQSLVDFIDSYKKPDAAPTNQKKGSKTIKTDEGLLSTDNKNVITLPNKWKNKSHREKLIYFIPEWDDLVNPHYDFLTDAPPPGTGDGYDFAVYAHQIFEYPPYDGILISKVIVEAKKSKKAILEKLGVHRYLRVPRDFPIMGDCGAFGYIMEDEPPYETEEILKYYQDLDFDYGVSIDHLIVPGVLKKNDYYLINPDGSKHQIPEEEYEAFKQKKYKEVKTLNRQLNFTDNNEQPWLYKTEVEDEEKKLKRYEITINNGRDFIEGLHKSNYTFTPVGAAQGWSPDSYRHIVNEYQKMGYTYIALGGMVRTTSAKIIEVLESIKEILKPETKLHLFGVARPDALPRMQELGVKSIDSASFLRRAWLGAGSNYFTGNDKYSALRVPQAEKSPKAKKAVREGIASLEQVQAIEKKCLKLLRAFEKNKATLEDTLAALMEYDSFLGEGRKGLEEMYRRTLEDKPWKACDCKICREIGIEVIIFRGNNRNRRRGFHNTKVFYDQLGHTFGDR